MTIRTEIPDSVYVVKVTDGKTYIPCLPFEELSITSKLKNGTIVKFLQIKELGPGNDFYMMEVIDSGDIVLLPIATAEFLLRIPSKNKFR